MPTHDYVRFATEYANLGFNGTFYLAVRDIPDTLSKYLTDNDKQALDYGCGTGRSTRFLKSLGYETVGVDISADMLQQAKLKDTAGDYRLITSGQLPFEDESFDLVFSSFVFLEVSSLNEIQRIVTEMKRVLRKSGLIAIITAPPECYTGDWVSFSYDFPENRRTVQSGETIKLLIKGTEVVLYDYYWLERDYEDVFDTVGLKIADVLKPTGRDEEPIDWLDERTRPAMQIYLLTNAV